MCTQTIKVFLSFSICENKQLCGIVRHEKVCEWRKHTSKDTCSSEEIYLITIKTILIQNETKQWKNFQFKRNKK